MMDHLCRECEENCWECTCKRHTTQNKKSFCELALNIWPMALVIYGIYVGLKMGFLG